MPAGGRVDNQRNWGPVPAVICANREFSAWNKVKGAQLVSAVALVFWVFFLLMVFG